jgi:hypothetical protein
MQRIGSHKRRYRMAETPCGEGRFGASIRPAGTRLASIGSLSQGALRMVSLMLINVMLALFR